MAPRKKLSKSAGKLRAPSRKGPQPQRLSPGDWFEKLVAIQKRLRDPGGCPWDREQTHHTLRTYLIEEAYEVLDALESGDDEKFVEELGDLLLQVTFHSQIAAEAGRFDVSDVIRTVHEKMVRRHPHVFGESNARDAGTVLKQWEAIKREEKKGDQHYLASLPRALPALMRAQKAQSKVARVNFDWTELDVVVAKVEEELGELKEAIQNEDQKSVEEEIGDLLFAVVNLARKCKLDAETALHAATDKFVGRFNLLEDELRARGKKLGDVDLAELDAIWNAIKKTPNA